MKETNSEAEERERLRALILRSPARQHILALLIEGHSRKQIADLMNRSQHTIDSHLKAIYRALTSRNRARLILLANSILNSVPPSPPPEVGNGDELS